MITADQARGLKGSRVRYHSSVSRNLDALGTLEGLDPNDHTRALVRYDSAPEEDPAHTSRAVLSFLSDPEPDYKQMAIDAVREQIPVWKRYYQTLPEGQHRSDIEEMVGDFMNALGDS